MARFALLLVCCLAAAITVRGADPEVCSSDDWDIIALPPVRDTDEAVASNQLARFVANTIRLKPDCKVLKSRTKFEKACSMAVEKGDVLERDDTKAKATGTLYDMVIVSSVKCPNGHYKVRYEARGIKPKSGKSTKLKGMQTRLIDVFDSYFA